MLLTYYDEVIRFYIYKKRTNYGVLKFFRTNLLYLLISAFALKISKTLKFQPIRKIVNFITFVSKFHKNSKKKYLRIYCNKTRVSSNSFLKLSCIMAFVLKNN